MRLCPVRIPILPTLQTATLVTDAPLGVSALHYSTGNMEGLEGLGVGFSYALR